MKNSFFTSSDKRGTVILSHYRSGGSQLRHIILAILNRLGIPHIDFWELDFNLKDIKTLEDQIDNFFYRENDLYSVTLLNNPQVITFLDSINYFEKLSRDFHVIHLERKNKRNCFLSLGLWEKFIEDGHYSNRETWTRELMTDFHNSLIQKPLPYSNLYIGIHFPLKVEPADEYINYMVMSFFQCISINKGIATRYNIPTLYYEEYEKYTTEFYNEYLVYYKNILETQESKKRLKRDIFNTYTKIPYISDDYLVYFDQYTKDAFKYWGI